MLKKKIPTENIRERLERHKKEYRGGIMKPSELGSAVSTWWRDQEDSDILKSPTVNYSLRLYFLIQGHSRIELDLFFKRYNPRIKNTRVVLTK